MTDLTSQQRRKQLLLFFGATFAMAAAMGGIHESIFNNFLSDTFNLSAEARGALEFPRELPGFLVIGMSGLLAALPVATMGAVGAATFCLGMIGLALLGGHWSLMVTMMIIGSAGMHLNQPVSASLALGLSDSNRRGKRMGQMGAIQTCGMILGAGIVFLFFDKENTPYRLGFLLAALGGGVAAVLLGSMHVPHLHQRRKRIVLKRKFRVYYLLEFLFGGRKQIFITFGPWVLIKVYGEEASGIAFLLLVAALIGIAFKPLAGMAIDRFGTRKVMMADGLMLACVCIGYGYAMFMTSDRETARLIAATCYVLDSLLFALGTARAVYLSTLTDDSREITSTLATGISINHIASMTIPFFAGAMWTKFGYQRVFLAAAGLAICISICSLLTPRHRRETA